MFIEYYVLAVYVATQYLKESFKSGPGRQFYRAPPLSSVNTRGRTRPPEMPAACLARCHARAGGRARAHALKATPLPYSGETFLRAVARIEGACGP
jgi:hypothetical protein